MTRYKARDGITVDNLREKVMNGLQMAYTYSNVDEENTLVPQQIVIDAITLLKAQEPRVMTLKDSVSAECVWIEYATSGNIVIALPWDIELTDDTYNFIGMPNCFVEFRSLYGKTWRCWTSRPTDEQRNAVKWK